MTPEAEHTSLVIELLQRSGITEFEVSDGTSHFKIRLPWDEARTSSATPFANKSDRDVEVASPGVGTFVARHPSRRSNFVEIGARITEGDVIAMIRVGLIFRPVVAPCSGTILRCHRRNGDQVDYLLPLFTIRAVTK